MSFTAADAYFPSHQLLETARENIQKNAQVDPGTLHARHMAVWAELWRKSDIQISATDTPGYNSQLAIRTAIFHLLKAKGTGRSCFAVPQGLHNGDVLRLGFLGF